MKGLAQVSDTGYRYVVVSNFRADPAGHMTAEAIACAPTRAEAELLATIERAKREVPMPQDIDPNQAITRPE